MSSTQPSAIEASSVECALESLDKALIQTLGHLCRAPAGVPELTIAVLPLASRMSLRAAGVIEPEGAAEGVVPSVTLTDFGREVIAAAAARHNDEDADTPDLALLESRAREILLQAMTAPAEATPA
jgi:hypothetical protein